MRNHRRFFCVGKSLLESPEYVIFKIGIGVLFVNKQYADR
jgi:hypothetical protein